MHGRASDDDRVGIKKAIKSDPSAFFGCVDLKKKRVAIWSCDICDLFADFMLMMYGCLLIPEQISCRTTSLLVLFTQNPFEDMTINGVFTTLHKLVLV
jgi:hypothetical protein